MLAAIARSSPARSRRSAADRGDALIPAHLDALPLARRLGAGLSPVGHDLAAAMRFAAVALELDTDPDGAAERHVAAAAGERAGGAAARWSTRPSRRAGDLLDTLRAYIDHGASISATAAAIYAHRHTVSNRLERVQALTGHDPQTPGRARPSSRSACRRWTCSAALSRAAR